MNGVPDKTQLKKLLSDTLEGHRMTVDEATSLLKLTDRRIFDV